tara:strand:+ start:493 stop:1020 length:528 start_codon:yes stop_codon:yes gene_type:complete
MSTLKVDTILKRTGTGTITVGQSGDTVTLGTGASQSGFSKINQVLQTLNTSSGNQNTTSTSPGATAVAASITPTSTSSKILVNFQFNFLQNDPQYTSQFYIYRGGSSIYQKSDYHSSDTDQQRRIMNLMYLDSPSSTSSVTYTLYTAVSNASGYLRILAGTDFDSANIILQEVLA